MLGALYALLRRLGPSGSLCAPCIMRSISWLQPESPRSARPMLLGNPAGTALQHLLTLAHPSDTFSRSQGSMAPHLLEKWQRQADVRNLKMSADIKSGRASLQQKPLHPLPPLPHCTSIQDLICRLFDKVWVHSGVQLVVAC